MGDYLNKDTLAKLNNLIKNQKRRNVSLIFNCYFKFLQQEEVLCRDEVKTLITAALDMGIFEQFVKHKEQQTEEAIEALFTEIFLDVFIDQDDEMLDEEQYSSAVNAKLGNDKYL